MQERSSSTQEQVAITTPTFIRITNCEPPSGRSPSAIATASSPSSSSSRALSSSAKSERVGSARHEYASGLIPPKRGGGR